MFRRLTDLTIEINQRCPNRCLFCSSLARRDSAIQLEVEDILAVARQAAALGLRRVSISGGEPLLHSSVLEILTGLTKIGLSVSLYTTGTRWVQAEPTAEDWSTFLVALPTLIFNLQSLDEDVHDHLMGRRGAFAGTKVSLLSAIHLGFRVEVHIVPTRLNLASIEATVTELARWGVNEVSFLRLVPQGYARDNIELLRLNPAENEALTRIFRNLIRAQFEELHLRFGIPFSGQIESPKKCNAGVEKLIIRYDGKVLPCEAFKDCRQTRFILGDIRESSLRTMLGHSASIPELRALRGSVCRSDPCPAQQLY